ncbi:MAG: alpha/beta hydrolase family protein [Acidobacteriota bacterium]|jgi:hypothetical protein
MSIYGDWIESWERKLTLRDRRRRVFPFEWGLDWLGLVERDGAGPLETLRQWACDAVRDSELFYHAPPMESPGLESSQLVFATPTPSLLDRNNRARCRIWYSTGSKGAVVVLPQWNAAADSHVILCRMLSKLGITAVRMTLPYHEERAPEGMERADFLVGPNIGRTLHGTRQAVLETLQVVGWLREQGYEKIGVMGTSLGSCVAYLAFSHSDDIDTGVFNHVSAHFADVVWTGLSTRYVRWALEGNISLEELRDCWAPLSPWFFIERLRQYPRPHLMITARYDLTFLPRLSDLVFSGYGEQGLGCDRVELPCGHYTMAHFPFNVLDGWHICKFLHRRLV